MPATAVGRCILHRGSGAERAGGCRWLSRSCWRPAQRSFSGRVEEPPEARSAGAIPAGSVTGSDTPVGHAGGRRRPPHDDPRNHISLPHPAAHRWVARAPLARAAAAVQGPHPVATRPARGDDRAGRARVRPAFARARGRQRADRRAGRRRLGAAGACHQPRDTRRAFPLRRGDPRRQTEPDRERQLPGGGAQRAGDRRLLRGAGALGAPGAGRVRGRPRGRVAADAPKDGHPGGGVAARRGTLPGRPERGLGGDRPAADTVAHGVGDGLRTRTTSARAAPI